MICDQCYAGFHHHNRRFSSTSAPLSPERFGKSLYGWFGLDAARTSVRGPFPAEAFKAPTPSNQRPRSDIWSAYHRLRSSIGTLHCVNATTFASSTYSYLYGRLGVLIPSGLFRQHSLRLYPLTLLERPFKFYASTLDIPTWFNQWEYKSH